MSGDINAINSWARSVNQRALAIAMNTGCSAADAKEHLISGKPLPRRDSATAAEVIDQARKTRTGV